MNSLLKGKNIFITGAGGNIGRSVAIESAKHGANVYFTDIDNRRLKSLERVLSQYPTRSQGFQLDITKTKDIDLLYQRLSNVMPRFHVLCNNVGLQGQVTDKFEINLSKWRQMFEVNVFGPMYLTQLFSERMIAGHIAGSIIFVTSIHQWNVRRIASYSATKGALGMIIKELAVELAPFGIRVNGIAPGYVDDDKKGASLPHPPTPLYKSSIPPAYIARTFIYLASDYFSKFTTGSVVTIDAGLSMVNHLAETD